MFARARELPNVAMTSPASPSAGVQTKPRTRLGEAIDLSELTGKSRHAGVIERELRNREVEVNQVVAVVAHAALQKLA